MKIVYIHHAAMLVLLPMIIVAPRPVDIVLAVLLFVFLNICMNSAMDEAEAASSKRAAHPSAFSAAPAAPPEHLVFRTDHDGKFSVLTSKRVYEFQGGAGCDRESITQKMARLVVAHLERQGERTVPATFFAIFGAALEEKVQRVRR
ncbi:MAG: hypothetical protein HC884_13540 [Chloroflexaceae bacterium]|nr:hypothetical protein [Chloroflexaceae bacterium]